MKRQIVLLGLILVVILEASHGIAGPMIGDDAKTQFSSWIATFGGTYLNFDELSARTQLDNQYASQSVRFKSIGEPERYFDVKASGCDLLWGIDGDLRRTALGA